jgi:hypothetical protein
MSGVADAPSSFSAVDLKLRLLLMHWSVINVAKLSMPNSPAHVLWKQMEIGL